MKTFKDKSLIVILFLGILFRLIEYIANRSLWFDEALAFHRIKSFSLSDLTNALSGAKQGYPMIFMAIQKFLINFLGSHEYVLRFFPVLAGVVALCVFYRLVKQFLPPYQAIFALIYFSLSPGLIYYASEAKPYSSDVLLVVILYYLFFTLYYNKNTVRPYVYYLAAGLSVWLSFSSVFVLFGCAIVLIGYFMKQKDKGRLNLLVKLLAISIVSVGIYYVISLRTFVGEGDYTQKWEWAFLTADIAGRLWSSAQLTLFFKLIFNYTITAAGFLLFVGVVYLLKRDRVKLMLLIAPILLTVLASFLKYYPIYARLILFWSPSIIFLMAEAIEGLGSFLRALNRKKMFFPLLLFCFFILPIATTVRQSFAPYGIEEIKPLMFYLKDAKRDDEIIYVYKNASFAFQYYALRYGLKSDEYIVGKTRAIQEKEFMTEMSRLKTHKRIWLVLSHMQLPEAEEVHQAFKKEGVLVKKKSYVSLLGARPFFTWGISVLGQGRISMNSGTHQNRAKEGAAP